MSARYPTYEQFLDIARRAMPHRRKMRSAYGGERLVVRVDVEPGADTLMDADFPRCPTIQLSVMMEWDAGMKIWKPVSPAREFYERITGEALREARRGSVA